MIKNDNLYWLLVEGVSYAIYFHVKYFCERTKKTKDKDICEQGINEQRGERSLFQ